MIKFYRFIFLLVFPLCCLSQEKSLLTSQTIPSILKTHANAVIRWDAIAIEVKNFDKMLCTNKRIVTVLNSSGDSKVEAFLHYDENTKIKTMEARVYNANGAEIKKFKERDFEDVSAVSGGTLYSDSRVKYLKYAPLAYPYTVVFETEVEYRSTGFLPGWRPLEGYFTSTENASYAITNSSGVAINTKTNNFEAFGIEKINDLSYRATNLKAIESEAYIPNFETFAPILKATLTNFEMEGVKGYNTNWKDFGQWMNTELILETQELPDQVKNTIRELTSSAKSNLEKAKIVYEYVQHKTRYISVQVGIGGWQPMLASDVDRLGYGDCKGLTNYTKALLNEVGVESYYTVIYGGKNIRDLDATFSSIQGNHVILCLPNDDEYLWLECTSQTAPFGFTANFTDDRNALILTPEGGKIVRTKAYATSENLLDTKATIVLSQDGHIEANIHLKSFGTQYSGHEGVQNKVLKKQKLHYKNYWNTIQNLDLLSMNYINDKDAIMFEETISLKAQKYATKVGERLLLSPNLFNVLSNVPTRYRDRKLPFEIDRGFLDHDEYEIIIPENFEVESLQPEVNLKNQFGEYHYEISKTSAHTLLFKRKFILNKGQYAKEAYEDFRNFWIQINKHDASRIVLIKNA